MPERVAHRGGCHRGRVRFEMFAPATLDVLDCACSICTMCGFLHLIVEAQHFRLLCGEENIATYQFGTHGPCTAYAGNAASSHSMYRGRIRRASA